MQEICSYGSVGERGGNEPLYPETWDLGFGIYFELWILNFGFF